MCLWLVIPTTTRVQHCFGDNMVDRKLYVIVYIVIAIVHAQITLYINKAQTVVCNWAYPTELPFVFS